LKEFFSLFQLLYDLLYFNLNVVVSDLESLEAIVSTIAASQDSRSQTHFEMQKLAVKFKTPQMMMKVKKNAKKKLKSESGTVL